MSTELLSLPGFIAIAFGYLFGSIPFGLVLTRAAGLGDVRKIGSGNIGATNVLRTGHKKLAAATLFLDGFKGFAAVVLVGRLSLEQSAPAEVLAIAAGLGAFIGHIFPVWLGFRGGKGVATYIGVLLALSWSIGLAFCAIWLAVAGLTRYSSLAALTAAAATPILLLGFANSLLAALFLVLSALLFWTHRTNIARLREGTESRIGAAKAQA